MPLNRNRLILILASALALGGFLIVCNARAGIGFPLDDAWIHQTYARNLADRGEWAFLPGQPSAGSTAPLWSALLAVGHLVGGNPPYFWTYLLGVLCLAGLACSGQTAFNQLSSSAGPALPWVGLLLAVEWHLVWAAASGMETILQALLSVTLFALLLRPASPRLFFAAGALVGFSAWVRPDGLTLIGPALFAALLFPGPARSRLTRAGLTLAGFALLFIPYLGFNLALAGELWPNTFFAKQAEYAILIQQPLWARLGSLAALPLVGVGVTLLPGALYAVIKSTRRILSAWRSASAIQPGDLVLLAMFLWWLGYTVIYALRLPVTYQHGRYLMPAMPVFFLLGLLGTVWLLSDLPLAQKWRRRLRFAAALTIAGVALSFYALGARSYSDDVAIIQTEMVQTAHWVAQNTPPDALVAAHDIGALGYYADRQLVDLAGLISPEVIPFIRDETRLVAYLDERQVDYLVTFPGWYPQLIQNRPLLYTTGGLSAPAQGGENMAVYRWLLTP